MVRSIGADRAIDYTQEDFTRGERRYDLMFDCIGNHSPSRCLRVLNPGGRCVMVGGPKEVRRILALALKALVLSWFVSQKFVVFIARRSSEDLTTLHDLMVAGKVTPIIDRCYRLSEAPEALRYLASGHARGKVVITLDHDDNT